ncbi:FtsH protease activity modulator HflK [Isoalcanivorax beigongshangi]|uniref:Protein HflK n=1 Tax=Isoalcanivorax beigongshangi TaxID=3238810 RepID=A0ABV4ADR7_9GAMM
MAWNEPGGNKPRDPWGGGSGGKNTQGPPDLDEVFKNLKQKFTGGGGGSQGSGAGFPKATLGLVAALLAVLYLFWAAFQVDAAEQAVVLRFGKLHRVVDSGLNWHLPPFEQYRKVNVTQVRSHRVSEEMLTGDTNIVGVTLEVQYRVFDPEAYLLKVANADSMLRNATESALRHVAGSKTINAVLSTEREELRVAVQHRLQHYLDEYSTGLLVQAVVLDSTEAPAAVRDAFQDVTRAREDEDRFKKEAEAYANSLIPEARGRAQRLREEAQAYRAESVDRAEGEAERFGKLLTEYRRAPEVTRERLYLETLEAVFGNSSKVLVDSEGSNNMMYLPLDQLMRERAASGTGSNADSSAPRAQTSTDSPATSQAPASRSLYNRQREAR